MVVEDWHAFVRRRLASLPAACAPAIVDELAQHLGDLYDEARRGGRSHGEALAIARDALEGDGVRLARDLMAARHSVGDVINERWTAALATPPSPASAWTRALGDLRRDVLYALRLLVRTPAFTVVAVLMLALGIGVNTAIFSLVNATLLARLPDAEIDRLVYVGNGPNAGSVFSYPAYAGLRDRNDVFDGLIAWGGITVSFNLDSQTDTVGGAIVTGNYFEVLGVSAGLGRVLSRGDDMTPGAHPVAVISHGLWQRGGSGAGPISLACRSS